MGTHPEPTLVELIRYNNWANAQVIAACQKLTDGTGFCTQHSALTLHSALSQLEAHNVRSRSR
jgi:uncharacterized damage-inducible protein DinB